MLGTEQWTQELYHLAPSHPRPMPSPSHPSQPHLQPSQSPTQASPIPSLSPSPAQPYPSPALSQLLEMFYRGGGVCQRITKRTGLSSPVIPGQCWKFILQKNQRSVPEEQLASLISLTTSHIHSRDLGRVQRPVGFPEEEMPDSVPACEGRSLPGSKDWGLWLYWAGRKANGLDLLGQESHLWVGHLPCLHLGGDIWIGSVGVEPGAALTH